VDGARGAGRHAHEVYCREPQTRAWERRRRAMPQLSTGQEISLYGIVEAEADPEASTPLRESAHRLVLIATHLEARART
jgi:hypothetical protein